MIPLLLLSCQRIPSESTLYSPDHEFIRFTGRIDFSNPVKPRLTGAGAYFEVKFRGTSVTVLLEDEFSENRNNYIAYEIDGAYQGRFELVTDSTDYVLATNLQDTVHTLIVSKATEAMIGYVDFSGIVCRQLLPAETTYTRRMEFIGDSITSGTGLDTEETPCNTGEWHDQHNAYLTYGHLAAKALDADWLLSSVSGIGMTRTWNREEPSMPAVYGNTFLNTDTSAEWDAQIFIPDLVSICLGTNDFSGGDGSYERAALDSTHFVNTYIQFVKQIRSRYPQAEIFCLNSPLMSTGDRTRLANYLTAVTQYMEVVEEDSRIHMFSFDRAYFRGCGHPNAEDHVLMAEALVPIFKDVMHW